MLQGGLSPRGFSRANHLASLVKDGTWPRFAGIFVTNSHTRQHMIRELQTAEPTGRFLGLTINETFAKDEEVGLAQAMKAQAQAACAPVLAVWEHCRIPAIAIALGCTAPGCVACWSDKNFGELLRIDVGEHAGTGVLLERVSESFDGDDWAAEVEEPSFDNYECERSTSDALCGTSDGVWHCPCTFPSGEASGVTHGPWQPSHHAADAYAAEEAAALAGGVARASMERAAAPAAAVIEATAAASAVRTRVAPADAHREEETATTHTLALEALPQQAERGSALFGWPPVVGLLCVAAGLVVAGLWVGVGWTSLGRQRLRATGRLMGGESLARSGLLEHVLKGPSAEVSASAAEDSHADSSRGGGPDYRLWAEAD